MTLGNRSVRCSDSAKRKPFVRKPSEAAFLAFGQHEEFDVRFPVEAE